MSNFKKIKILVLFSSKDIGGAERSLTRMALSNKNKKISYQLSTYSSPGAWSRWVSSKDGHPLCFNHSLFKLLKYIYREKPDIIYVIGFRLSVLLRFLKIIKSKIILVQGVRWSPVSNSKLDKTFRVFERFFSFLIDGYIVNSDSAQNLLFSISIDKVKLIYNGISNISFNEKKSIQKKYITTIANLSLRKGYFEYLEIIERIVKKFPQTQFLFLGYDNLNGEVQRLIKKKSLSSNVKYLGFKENIGDYLNESKIFVLPSLYGEGCPTSILEAFKFKLPVIAYEIDGIPEIVNKNVDGILVDQSNKNSLEEAIIDLLTNPDKINFMGEKGYEKVKANYSLNNMLDKHNSFFLDLV